MDDPFESNDPFDLMNWGFLRSFGPVDLPDGRRAMLWLLDAITEDNGSDMEWIPRVKTCAAGQEPPEIMLLDVVSMRRQKRPSIVAEGMEAYLVGACLFQPAITSGIVDFAIDKALFEDDRTGPFNKLVEVAIEWPGSGWDHPSSHSGESVFGPFTLDCFAKEREPGSGKWHLVWVCKDGTLNESTFDHSGPPEELGAAIAKEHGFDQEE